MKKLIAKIQKKILFKFMNKQKMEKIIFFLSRLANINLLMLAYQNMGILKYKNFSESGERFVIKSVLTKYIKKEKPIFFDIGANLGDYTRELKLTFPNAAIYAFEPFINAFEIMKTNSTLPNINCFNLGFGSKAEKKRIYIDINHPTNGHASFYKDVLRDIHKVELTEKEIEITMVDNFCDSNQVSFIDFLKIDTEGSEMEVLKGAKQMISRARIDIIQFEFNEMNVCSRVFLKDFYELLSRYNIYRIDSDRLIPLFEYDTTNEIFKFQNFLAINKKLNLSR